MPQDIDKLNWVCFKKKKNANFSFFDIHAKIQETSSFNMIFEILDVGIKIHFKCMLFIISSVILFPYCRNFVFNDPQKRIHDNFSKYSKPLL